MQMIAGTDYSRRRRGPFLAPIEIVVLATMVGALLFLLFPGRDFENPKHLTRADDLSMAYLRMLLRAHPEDGDARLLLVQQQMALGRLEEATETLAPLRSRKDELGAKAEVVALKLDRTRLWAIPPDDPLRRERQAEVKLAAQRLLPRTTRVDDLTDLADFMLSLGDPAEAARAYQRLAGLDKGNAIGWLEKAGRWSYAAGDPALAARVYSEAALQAPDEARGARLGRLALVALLAANQGRAGLASARPLVERYPRDLGLLEQAVRMAVAAGDLSTARRWGEQRVAAAGSSDQALRDQVDILTKAGDPVGALRVARTLLGRHPGDAGLRKQAAQLARWSSEPEESLSHWVWLARRGSEDARKTALELAQALGDVGTEVEMLEMRMRQARRMAAPRVLELEGLRKQRQPRVAPRSVWPARRRPMAWRVAQATPPAAPPATTSVASGPTLVPAEPAERPAPQKAPARKSVELDLNELISLADALEAKGLPERAIKNMDDFRFNFADRPEYWVRIARLYENAGELEQALACFEQLNRLKAMTLDDAIRQSKLLWRLLRPEAALTRLVGLRGQAKPTEVEYWRLVGHLAWRVENDLLAADAFNTLWKIEKTADVAEPLFRTLDSLGQAEEAITVAEEAYERLGQSQFLVSAVDIAVRRGLLDRAKALFAKARGKEKQFELETHFWFQRAQLAFGEDRYSDAEQDLRRVLAIDPGSEDAHVEWLTLAVHAQDRGMAERALKHWGLAAEADAESWGLLSDAYQLLDDEGRALKFRRLAREERRRQRLASGRPMTPEEHVEEAIERRDRHALEAGLRLYGASLSLPSRVAALRELGRDDEAWALISAAGLAGSGGRRGGNSETALALAADIRDLRENYLDGVWLGGQIRTLGQLEERRLGARFELRFGNFFIGAEASANQLLAPRRRKLVEGRDQEQRGYLTARLRESFGATSLRAGLEFLPEGYIPQVGLEQHLYLFRGRLEANLRGTYGDVPTNSAILRAVALRDVLEGDAVVRVAGPFELGAWGTVNRIVTRYDEELTIETAGRFEAAFRLPFKSVFLRPRADFFANQAPPLRGTIPRSIEVMLTGEEDPRDVLGLQYTSLGLGLGIGSTLAEVAEARGPHISLRYYIDAWGGYVLPVEQKAYAVDAALGLVFARHQELSARGFYYSDFRNIAGEAWWGGTVNYTLRWFR